MTSTTSVNPVQSVRLGSPQLAQPPARLWTSPAVLALFAAGLLVRLAFILPDRLGLLDDTDFFLRWTRELDALGLRGFYAAKPFCDYPPFFVLVMRGLGWLARVTHLLASDHAMRILLKLPATIADVAIAALLLIEGRRRLTPPLALGAACLYWLNPVAFYNSAYWGQVDAIHTAFLVAALLCIGRSRWIWAGLLAGLALAQKFQAIAIVPLFLIESFRLRGWRGLAMFAFGTAAGWCCVASPFAWCGVLNDVVARGYVHVVGQYSKLSPSAFNIWQLAGAADISDATPPRFVVYAAGLGSPTIAADSSILLQLTWRRLALTLWSMSILLVLSLYTYRPGQLSRYAAATLLALAFFLFPTEMHERYAHPAMAFGAIWAVTGRWQERGFFLLSALLLLNLAHILPPGAIAAHIGALLIALFMLGLVGPFFVDRAAAVAPALPPDDQPIVRPVQTRVFRMASYSISVLLVSTLLTLYLAGRPPHWTNSGPVCYLSTLEPAESTQTWGKLHKDASVLGSLMRLDDRIHLVGLGTHAPSTIVFEIPAGYSRFKARVGIDRDSKGKGSAVASVQLDGREVFTSDVLRGNGPGVDVDVPLDGARRLTLRTRATSDGPSSDHVDWAVARFERDDVQSR